MAGTGESQLTKFAEVAKRFDQEKPDLVVCLGDLIDSAVSLDAEKGYLRQLARELGGLHYCTLSAVIEGSGVGNNAYAALDILPGDVIRFIGFRKQKSYGWA
jgi:hypothetical protein